MSREYLLPAGIGVSETSSRQYIVGGALVREIELIATPVGLAIEIEAAFNCGSASPLGLSTETDSAFSLAGRQAAPVGLSTEATSAFALGRVAIIASGSVAEIDMAMALACSFAIAVGMAEEADTAIARAGASPAGVAIETDEAFACRLASLIPVPLTRSIKTSRAGRSAVTKHSRRTILSPQSRRVA